MRWCLFLIAALAGCVSTVAPVRTPNLRLAPLGEVWVDASARSFGTGTSEAPFKDLGKALESGIPAAIHIRPGLYLGPFHVGSGQVLTGEGTVVLYADTGTVITAEGEARLESVTIQGGAIGIETRGDVSLSHLELTGQRQTAISVLGGRVRIVDSLFHAAVSQTQGLVIQSGAVVAISRSRFTGPFQRAIEARSPGRVTVEHCDFADAVTGFWQSGGEARILDCSVAGGRGPAIFLAQGDFELIDVRVHGHEFGLQARQTHRLKVRGFSSVSADRSGIALIQSVADLADITVIRSGSFGAFQMVGGDVQLRDFRIYRPDGYGVMARQGRLLIENGIITDVGDSEGNLGDGVHLRQITAVVRSVTVQRSAGAGVLVAEAAIVQLRDVDLKQCRVAGIFADTLANLDAVSVSVEDSRGPAVVVVGDAHLRLDALRSFRNNDGAIWADCAQGAQVVLTRLRGDDPRTAHQPCVSSR